MICLHVKQLLLIAGRKCFRINYIPIMKLFKRVSFIHMSRFIWKDKLQRSRVCWESNLRNLKVSCGLIIYMLLVYGLSICLY